MIKIEEREYECPIEFAMELIAGKWKLLIMWHLRSKTRRFGELQRKIPKVTQKMLTQQLRELERDGLVHREVYPVVPPKVEYSLTPFGKTLKPILSMMVVWGFECADSIQKQSYELSEEIEPEYRKQIKEEIKKAR